MLMQSYNLDLSPNEASAGAPFVKPPPTQPGEEPVPWNEGSQQSQLLIVVACRLNKLEGSRPRGLVDWTYSPIVMGT